MPPKTDKMPKRRTRSSTTADDSKKTEDLDGFSKVRNEDLKKTLDDVNTVMEGYYHDLEVEVNQDKGKAVITVEEEDRNSGNATDDLDALARELELGVSDIPKIQAEKNANSSTPRPSGSKSQSKVFQIQSEQEKRASDLKVNVENAMETSEGEGDEPENEPLDPEDSRRIEIIRNLLPGICEDLNTVGIVPDNPEKDLLFEYLMIEGTEGMTIRDVKALVIGYRKRSEKSLKSHESYLSEMVKKFNAVSKEMRQNIIEFKKQNDEYRKICSGMKAAGAEVGKMIPKPSREPIPVPTGASKLSAIVGLPPSSSKTIITKSAADLLNKDKEVIKKTTKLESLREKITNKRSMNPSEQFELYSEILGIGKKSLVEIDESEGLAMVCILKACEQIKDSELSRAAGNSDMAREFRYDILDQASKIAKAHKKKQKRGRSGADDED